MRFRVVLARNRALLHEFEEPPEFVERFQRGNWRAFAHPRALIGVGHPKRKSRSRSVGQMAHDERIIVPGVAPRNAQARATQWMPTIINGYKIWFMSRM